VGVPVLVSVKRIFRGAFPEVILLLKLATGGTGFSETLIVTSFDAVV